MNRRASLVVMVVVLAGCATAARPVSIGELLANPAQSENHEVQVRGCYLYKTGGISALSEDCPAALSNDYRPYSINTIDLVPADKNAPLEGHYVEVIGLFRSYGKKDDVFPGINLRGVSDIGQIEVSRMRTSKTP